MTPFALVTPAHNEAAFLEKTILSVLAQTVRPRQWFVVNDGSTDDTEAIIKRYEDQHPFIQPMIIERAVGHNPANMVAAVNRGLAEARRSDYEYIGKLDADISLEPNYFENILGEFQKNPKLGIGGGIVFTKMGGDFVTQDETLDSVAGGVQMFRRQCLEEVGYYLALPFGGSDAAAEITARMKGWTVRKFPENRVWEYRRTGTAAGRGLRSRVREGRRFYSLGYSALFYLLRCSYRLKDRPFMVGSLAGLCGYFESRIRRRPVLLPEEAVLYLRSEQRQKIKRALRLPSPACPEPGEMGRMRSV